LTYEYILCSFPKGGLINCLKIYLLILEYLEPFYQPLTVDAGFGFLVKSEVPFRSPPSLDYFLFGLTFFASLAHLPPAEANSIFTISQASMCIKHAPTFLRYGRRLGRNAAHGAFRQHIANKSPPIFDPIRPPHPFSYFFLKMIRRGTFSQKPTFISH